MKKYKLYIITIHLICIFTMLLLGCGKQSDSLSCTSKVDDNLYQESIELDDSENNVQQNELINDDDNINYFNDLFFEDSCVSIYDFNKPESVGFYKEDGWILDSAEEGITNVSNNTIEPENAVYYLPAMSMNWQDNLMPAGIVIGRDNPELCRKIDRICETKDAIGIRMYYDAPSDMTAEQKEYVAKLPDLLCFMRRWHNTLIKPSPEDLAKIPPEQILSEEENTQVKNFYVSDDIEQTWKNLYDIQVSIIDKRSEEESRWKSWKEFREYELEGFRPGDFVFVTDVEPIYE